MEEISAIDITTKMLIYKIYKWFIQLNIQKNPIKKLEDLSRHFSKGDRWLTGTSKAVQHN